MPAVSKAGAGAPKRAAAAPAIVEDPSTLVPCPVITAHPNGFVERTEPERETHEVRCVPPHAPSVFPDNGTSRGSTRARRRARPARRIAPRGEKTSRVMFPVDARARGSTRKPRYAARADRASPHPPDRTVSRPEPRDPRARPPKTTPHARTAKKLTVRFAIFHKKTLLRSAYKLGKKKRSYNQVELTFDKASFGKRFGVNVHERSDDPSALNIYEATERSFSLDVPASMRDSALEYELKLYNGASVRALIYLVYAEPLVSGSKVPGQTPALGLNGAPLTDEGGDNAWLPVTRARCAKGCAGPILSAIQRFGKQGRTQKGAGKEPAKPETGQDKWKDARNLFISIDEASNHVCAFGPNKCKVFRCVFVVFFSRPVANGRFRENSARANSRAIRETPSTKTRPPVSFSPRKRTKRPSRAAAGSRALPSSAPPRRQTSVRDLLRGRRRVPGQRRLRPYPRPRQQRRAQGRGVPPHPLLARRCARLHLARFVSHPPTRRARVPGDTRGVPGARARAPAHPERYRAPSPPAPGCPRAPPGVPDIPARATPMNVVAAFVPR